MVVLILLSEGRTCTLQTMIMFRRQTAKTFLAHLRPSPPQPQLLRSWTWIAVWAGQPIGVVLYSPLELHPTLPL